MRLKPRSAVGPRSPRRSPGRSTYSPSGPRQPFTAWNKLARRPNAAHTSISGGILAVEPAGLDDVSTVQIMHYTPTEQVLTQGEALPLSYDGSDTFPFETTGDDNSKAAGSIRNRILAVISFAHEHKLLAWINCKNPTAAAQKIDKWLSKQSWAVHADPECKITSHSFRKAGVSLASLIWRN